MQIIKIGAIDMDCPTKVCNKNKYANETTKKLYNIESKASGTLF
jgi:hypothetical protein